MTHAETRVMNKAPMQTERAELADWSRCRDGISADQKSGPLKAEARTRKMAEGLVDEVLKAWAWVRLSRQRGNRRESKPGPAQNSAYCPEVHRPRGLRSTCGSPPARIVLLNPAAAGRPAPTRPC